MYQLIGMILFVLASTGTTIIVTMSTIFVPFRAVISSLGPKFRELIHCQLCTGFWVGLCAGILYSWAFLDGQPTKILVLIAGSFAPTVSIVSYLTALIILTVRQHDQYDDADQ